MNVLVFHSFGIQRLQYKRIKYLINSLCITLKAIKNTTYFFWVTWLQNLFSSILFCWYLITSMYHFCPLSIYHSCSLFFQFGFSATCIYNSYFSSIFGWNALIWGYFQNVCCCRFWGHWGPLRSHKGNSVLDILRLQSRNFVIISENLVANLEKVRHASVRQMYLCSDLFVFLIVPQRLTLVRK